jgi:hypothetical protein
VTGEGDVDGEELLARVLIRPFLEFSQSIPAEKFRELAMEKITALLNSTRAIEQLAIEKYAETRQECAALASRASLSMESVRELQQCLHVERSCKHKSIMKYINEVLRLSDTRIAVSMVDRGVSLHERDHVGAVDIRLLGCCVDDETMRGVTALMSRSLHSQSTEPQAVIDVPGKLAYAASRIRLCTSLLKGLEKRC